MKIKRLILFSILILVVIAITLGIYFFWDMSRPKAVMEKEMASLFHRPVHIQKMRLQVFPHPQIILQGVDIKDRDRKSDFLFIEKLHIGISPLHLFTRLIYLRFLILDRPRITITRKEEKIFNISDLINVFPQNGAVKKIEEKKSWIKGFRFSLKKFTVRKGEIVYKDHSPIAIPISLRFVDLDLKINKISTPGLIPVTLRCRLKNKDRDAWIQLQGKIGPVPEKPTVASVRCKGNLEITSLPISTFWPYFPGWTKIGTPEGIIEGKASFTGFVGKKFESSIQMDIINLTLKNQEIFEKELKIERSHLNFFLMRDKNKVSLSSIKVILPEWTATGKFLLDKTDIPTLAAEIKIDNFDYHAALPYVPIALFPKEVKNLMTDKVLTGEIDMLSFRYSETFPTTPPVSPDEKSRMMEGKTSFRNFSLTIAEDIPPLKHLKGEISFKNGAFEIPEVIGTFGNSEIKRGNITLSKSGFLDISADFKLDLFDVHKLLHSKKIPWEARRRLKKLESLSGKALLKLDVSGPINDLSSLTFGGRVELLNANFDYKPFRKPGKNFSGTIQFTPYTIKILDIKGQWANSPCICSGEIENYRTRQSQIMVHVESENGKVNDLASAFFPWKGVRGMGSVKIAVDFYCPGYRKEKLRFKGQTKFQDISFLFPAFPHPFTHIGGEIDFSSDGLRFSNVEFKTGSSELSFSGHWDNLRFPVITGRFEGEFVDFLDFYKPPKPEKRKPSLNYTLDKITITIREGFYKNLLVNNLEATVNYHDGLLGILSLQVKNGKYRDFDFVNLSNIQKNEYAKITYQNRVATIPFLSLDSKGGSWVGKDIRLPFGPEKEENFSLTSEIRNISMEEFLGGVPPEKRNLTGTLNLKGKISGKGRNLSGWMETLNGGVSLSVEDGVLKKSGVLAKILLLLNVSRIFSQDYSRLLVKGMHYNTIQGDFQIENGIARTESILFDSPSVKMDAVGDINLGGETLDMEIAVAPLETVDKVVEKVPILGTILMGDEAAVVVTYYKVTGSFEDPEVKQIVFQSLGRKAMGIFMRIFKLPFTILKPGDNRPQEKNHDRMLEEPEISSQ